MRILKLLGRLVTRNDLLTRFELLRRAGAVLVPDYRFKWPQQGWWYDETFNAYLDRFNERRMPNSDRRWMMYQLLRMIDTVPGDTAECGVYDGAGSWIVCAMNRQSAQARTHFVFDSFEGLSEPEAVDGTHWKRGELACPLDRVRANLAEFERVSYHQGWIPARFGDAADRRFAFVHIDVDLYQPTLDSIEFFYPRIPPGGILLCDDYLFTSCPGATRACDEYLSDKPEKMLSLPAGGGFLVKGMETAPLLAADAAG